MAPTSRIATIRPIILITILAPASAIWTRCVDFWTCSMPSLARQRSEIDNRRHAVCQVQLPSATERLIQTDDRLQARESHLGERRFLLEPRLLDLKQRHDIDGAGAQPLLGELEGAARFPHRVALEQLLPRRLLHRHQRLLDVREGRDHRLAIVLQELLARPFLQVELAEQRSAVEYRLRQRRGDRVEGGARTEQRGESQALETALGGELNGGEEGGASGRHIGVGTRELGFRLPYVRSPHEQLRGQSGRHPRHREAIHAAAADPDVLRHAAYEQRQGGAVLLDLLHQGWNRRAHDGDQACLLGDIERGGDAVVEAVLDQLQDPLGRVQILARDVEKILSFEHQKIGIGDAHEAGERHDLAIKTAGGGGKFRRAQEIPIASPEVDHVACVQGDVVNRELAGASAAAAAATAAASTAAAAAASASTAAAAASTASTAAAAA